jgi:CBS-domain-containing membrane protein
MEKPNGARGKPVHCSARIGDIAAEVLAADAALPVIDEKGRIIGAVTRERMIAALFPPAES